MILMIPSYEPTNKLIQLIESLKQAGITKILVINDGSDKKYEPIFAQVENLGGTIIKHTVNVGKGEAIKTGLKYLKDKQYNENIVCADSDGQHSPEAILAVNHVLESNPGKLILGVRAFVGKVPIKSKLGNNFSKVAFKVVSGVSVSDTQTGLRGYSPDMIDWLLTIKGSRFEYEMNMLMVMAKEKKSFIEVPIETIYLENNRSTHFRPLKDSALVLFPVIKYAFIALLSFILDFSMLLIFKAIFAQLFISVVGARIISGTFNYLMNKQWVFEDDQVGFDAKSASKYFVLAIGILGLNYILLHMMYEIMGIPLVWAKTLTESLIFFGSFMAQKLFVFKSNRQINRSHT